MLLFLIDIAQQNQLWLIFIAANTFKIFCNVLADLPPSPRSRRQQNYQESGAKFTTDANNAKVFMVCFMNSAVVKAFACCSDSNLLADVWVNLTQI